MQIGKNVKQFLCKVGKAIGSYEVARCMWMVNMLVHNSPPWLAMG